jgi:hypothetical protein
MPKYIPTCSKKVLLQCDIKVQQKWTPYGHFYQAMYFNNFLFFHRYHVWFTFQAANSWQQWQ